MAFIDVSPSALRLSDERRSDLLVRHRFPPTLLLDSVVDRLLGKRCLMKKVNRGRARISRDVFQTKVCNEIVFRCVRMIFGDAAKARGQLVLHVKTRIG